MCKVNCIRSAMFFLLVTLSFIAASSNRDSLSGHMKCEGSQGVDTNCRSCPIYTYMHHAENHGSGGAAGHKKSGYFTFVTIGQRSCDSVPTSFSGENDHTAVSRNGQMHSGIIKKPAVDKLYRDQRRQSAALFNECAFDAHDSSQQVISRRNSETTDDKKVISWRLATSVSYNRYDEVFFIEDSLNPENNIKEHIKDKSITGDMLIASELKPSVLFVKELSPYLYFSNNRGKFGTDASLQFCKQRLKVNGSFEAQMRMHEHYNDSSNAVRVKINNTFTTELSHLELILKNRICGEQYKHNRPNYVSNREFVNGVSVGAKSTDFSKSIHAGIEYGFGDYDTMISTFGTNTIADTILDDRHQIASFTAMSIWLEYINLTLDGSGKWELYPFRKTRSSIFPEIKKSATCEMDFSCHYFTRFETGGRGAYSYEREYFGKYPAFIAMNVDSLIYDTLKAHYDIHSFIIEPRCTFMGMNGWETGMSFSIEKQDFNAVAAGKTVNEADTEHVQHWLEAQSSWIAYAEYALKGTLLYHNETVETNVDLVLRRRRIFKENSFFGTGDFWAFEPLIFVTWYPWSWLSCQGDCFFEYRRYIGKDDPSTAVSASLTVGVVF